MSICYMCHVCHNHPQVNVQILSNSHPQVPTKNLAKNAESESSDSRNHCTFFQKKNIDGFRVKFFGELCLRKPNRKTIQVQGNVNTGWISPQKVQKIIPKNSWQMLAMHIYSVIHAVHNVQRSDFCRLLSAIGAQSWRSRYLGEKKKGFLGWKFRRFQSFCQVKNLSLCLFKILSLELFFP